jgi:NAD(P)-dependent dehydrogenase (short-subunit alcohol dehydrogenase family)
MVEELTEDEVRAVLAVNFFGALWVTQAALPIMRRQRSGHLIQVTSEGGVRAFPQFGAYHAAKWALEGLSGSLAQEVTAFGIRLTCIEPGPYATDWSSVGLRRSAPDPDYQVVRDAIDRSGWQLGDPTATRDAILKVVDAAEPPLRIFFGRSLEPLVQEYEQRLATWQQWAPVSRAAFGDPDPSSVTRLE